MPMSNEIWIVDDDQSIRWVLEKALERAGHKTRLFESAEDLLNALSQTYPRVIVTDIRMNSREDSDSVLPSLAR